MKKDMLSFSWLASMYVAILIISNVASTKITAWGGMDAGTLLFPLAYIFGDIFAEVYGWRRARQVILMGFVGICLAAGIFAIVELLPPADYWPNQASYSAILGLVPRITLGSICGYLCGSLTNTWTLLWIKKITGQAHLWMRTIGSTLVGQTVDSTVFGLIAFLGVDFMSTPDLLILIGANILFKVSVEVILTPLTYAVIGKLKQEQAEHI